MKLALMNKKYKAFLFFYLIFVGKIQFFRLYSDHVLCKIKNVIISSEKELKIVCF